jgi:hypothetical protein
MKNNKLKDFEIEELEFMIPQIEKMYNFEFDKDKTHIVNSFEELCDLIIEKINLKNVESCTSQQAFYKLRKSLVETKIIEKESLNTQTELKKLFPRKNRKVLIKKVENEIKFKLDILKAPNFITIPLFAIGIISFFLLFIYWKLGLIGISISVIGFYLCKWFGNELKINNVKELAEKITNENYLSVRTEKNTINKTELKNVLTNWFSENTGIEKEKLETATFE